jgi:hypothetical protein
MLWSLTSHKINKELGYKAKPDVHAFKYDHEKDCADIFVSLALTGTLLEWQGEGDQKTGFRHDRMFSVDDRIFYLEVERGTQGDGKLRAKLERYIKHYHATHKPFNVLFTVQDEDALERMVGLFAEFKLGNQYAVVVHSEFVRDPLHARLTTRFDTFLLLNFDSSHTSNHAATE